MPYASSLVNHWRAVVRRRPATFVSGTGILFYGSWPSDGFGRDGNCLPLYIECRRADHGDTIGRQVVRRDAQPSGVTAFPIGPCTAFQVGCEWWNVGSSLWHGPQGVPQNADPEGRRRDPADAATRTNTVFTDPTVVGLRVVVPATSSSPCATGRGRQATPSIMSA
jgi:hypothetical protein